MIDVDVRPAYLNDSLPPPRALSIAGSDPSGGAGIQADLKAFSALGAYGMAAITALTAQNTRGVLGVEAVSADFLEQQIEAVFADITVDAVKIGMVGGPESVRRVARCLARHRPPVVILDPVMVAKSGHRLVTDEAVAVLRSELLPLATVVTPNLPEAAVLLDTPEPAAEDAMPAFARGLLDLGCPHVLLKGGHLEGPRSRDLLLGAEGEVWLDAVRVDTRNTHGTGCTLSSAIAALAPVAPDIATAVRGAKAYLNQCLASADTLSVGHGHGPVHHFHAAWACAPARHALEAAAPDERGTGG